MLSLARAKFAARTAAARVREAERAAQKVLDVVVPGPAGVPSIAFDAAERNAAECAVQRAKQRWIQAEADTAARR